MNDRKKKYITIMFFILSAILFILWAVRVYYINRNSKIKERIYSAGEEAVVGSWTVELSETKMLTQQEFRDFFKVEYKSAGAPDDKMLCIKLKVYFENGSPESGDFEDLVENGFRTLTWYQGIDPFLFGDMNVEGIQSVSETGEGMLWITTHVPSGVWDKENTYDYVLSTFPEVVTIRTMVGKGD